MNEAGRLVANLALKTRDRERKKLAKSILFEKFIEENVMAFYVRILSYG